MRVTLGDKRDTSLPAKIVGQDYDKDVAVLKLEDTNGKALSPVKVRIVLYVVNWKTLDPVSPPSCCLMCEICSSGCQQICRSARSC